MLANDFMANKTEGKTGGKNDGYVGAFVFEVVKRLISVMPDDAAHILALSKQIHVI